MQEICTRHRTTCEEMGAHPAILEIIRRIFMVEDMNKALPLWLQGPCDFGKKKFVILHVFEEFDRYYSVIDRRFKLVSYYVPCDNIEVGQVL